MSKPAAHVVWGDYADEQCSRRLGLAGGVLPLGECGVVPQSDAGVAWRGSSFRYASCEAFENGSVVVADLLFGDENCTVPFGRWSLSVGTRCVRVPVGPKTGPNPPLWHSVLNISCVDVPP